MQKIASSHLAVHHWDIVLPHEGHDSSVRLQPELIPHLRHAQLRDSSAHDLEVKTKYMEEKSKC